VTVVATGLGGAADKPKMTIVEETLPVHQEVNLDGKVDYGKLDRPTIMRKQVVGNTALEAAVSSDLDYLDIPAFLRRQAD